MSTARRASFALYFEDVDTGNHRAGPGIARLGMTNDVNVIVVSDHGSAPIARERTVFLDDYVSMDSLELTDTSPVATSVPKPGREAYVYRRLKDANPHLAIYRQADVPARVDGSIDSVRALLRRWTVRRSRRFLKHSRTRASSFP